MDNFWNYWNSLSQGVRDTIFGGIALAAILGIWKIFGKSIYALFSRIFNKTPPALPQVIVNLPPALVPSPPLPPPVADAQHAPLIPKSPGVGFVVRRDEEGHEIVNLLKEKLAPTSSQLVALWGEGGHGKTTLAAEAARALSEAFKQRIVWATADKRADFTFSTLLDEIAVQLNRSDLIKFAVEPKAAEVQSLVASAPTLVVLDNFETLAERERLRCIEFLAQHSPYPSLITTRQKVDGAYNVSVDAMTPPEAQEFLGRLIQQANNRSAFAGLKHDQIIEAAGRNPLVMQWVVAQIELAQRPREVLQDLAQGKGDAAQRVFDRSFQLEQLGDDGRATLLALSLFVSSASRSALAEVAGFGGDMARLNEAVKRLASLKLVGTTDGGERLTIQGLTRELAKAQLTKDERAYEFRQRFVTHFLNYAEAHAQRTPEDFDALEAEKDNVLNAIDVAIDLKDWERVQRIAYIASGVLSMHGYWDEAIKRNEQARDAAREMNWEHEIAVYSHRAGIIRQNRGEYDAARIANEEALAIYRKLNQEANEAAALHQLGLLAQDQGELEEARRLYIESLKIEKKLGDQSGIASTTSQLGILHYNLEEFTESKAKHEDSLAIRRRIGDPQGIAIDLHQLAMIAQTQGELEEARRLYIESLKIKKKLGDQSGIANTLHQLAILAQGQGNLEEARQLYIDSLEIKKRLGNQIGIAVTLNNLGLLTEEEGNKEEAVRLLREALDIFERLKSPNAEKARRSLERLETEAS